MARNDDSQQGTGAPSRVYKSSDVHKRRTDRKGRAKRDGSADVDASASEIEAGGESPAKDAVVIAPEFGRRTQARKEADDRWFEAMREEARLPAQGSEGAARADAPDASAGQGAAGDSPSGTVVSGETAALPRVPTPQENSSGYPRKPSLRGKLGKLSRNEALSAPAGRAEASGDGGASGKGGSPDFPDSPAPAVESQFEQSPQPAGRRISARLPRKRSARIALAVVAALLVAAIAAAALFAWGRWYRYDDRADMRGTWYVVGTTVPVSIDETSIRLTDDVAYLYEIDSHDKTIRYAFGPMEGQGRYWFSDDRQYLVITDGDEFDATVTAYEDVMHMLSDMGSKVAGSEARLPEGDGIIAFSRNPDPDVIARQKAEAAERAASEAAARQEAERRAAEEAAAAAAETAEGEEYYYEENAEGPGDENLAEGGTAEGGTAEEAPVEESQIDEPLANEAHAGGESPDGGEVQEG